MGTITISPEEFTLVLFEPERIIGRASEIAEAIGLEADVRIEIDESHPMGKLRVRSTDPVVLFAQGGAFEDPRRLRHLSEQHMNESLGRLLYRVHDRRDPGFAGVAADDELSLRELNVWDVYCLGRLAQLGYDVAKPRWFYHFRLRQGFTDVADAAFERLWAASGLTWANLEAVIAETDEARAAA